MANKVYANMMEVSCKKAAGSSICAFPDVCFTPPQTPATPPGVPIPYPNTGMATDTTKGTRDVKITGKEVMIKNKSYFKRSMGDEAGCAPKKGVVTSKNMGKVYFQMWSMDVKFEGSNAVRMLDIMTHNHSSVPGNTPTWPYIDGMDTPGTSPGDGPCKKDIEKEQKACANYKPNKKNGKDACAEGDVNAYGADAQEAMDKTKSTMENDCLKARKCQLVPYSKESQKRAQCCPGQTPHHVVEASSFYDGDRGSSDALLACATTTDSSGKKQQYSANMAPCICVSGQNQHWGSHGLMHTMQGNANGKRTRSETLDKADGTKTGNYPTKSYKADSSAGVKAVGKVFPGSKCDEKCLQAQLDAYHKQCGVKDDSRIRAIDTGNTSNADVKEATKTVKRKYTL